MLLKEKPPARPVVTETGGEVRSLASPQKGRGGGSRLLTPAAINPGAGNPYLQGGIYNLRRISQSLL